MKPGRPLCVLVTAFLAVVFFLLMFLPSAQEAKEESGTTVTLQGTLCRKESRIARSGEEIPVYLIKDTEAKDRQFLCELRALPSDAPAIGCVLTVKGTVTSFSTPTNPGEFDFNSYYAVQKISFRMQDATVLAISGRGNPVSEGLHRLRFSCAELLNATLLEEDAAIMRAMLLGDKTAMTSELKELYRDSGILHVLAVSGLHVGFVGLALYRLLQRLIPVEKKRLRAAAGVFCMLLITAYGLMCGMSASAFRAVVMFVMKVVADRYGRTYDVPTALSIAALLLVLDQPLYLTYAGFQFSFLCIIGLLAAGRVAEQLSGKRGEKLLKPLTTGLVLTLFTLPVQMWHMYTVPVYATLLNLLVVPLMSVLFPAGMAVLALGSLSLPLPAEQFPVFFCHGVLSLYEGLCTAAARLPLHTWYAGKPAAWQVAVYYVLLFLGLFYGSEAKGRAFASSLTHRLQFLLIIIAVSLLSYRPTPALQLTMLDVGQGDGIVLRQGSYNLLIDGGSTSKSSVGKYQLLPFLKHEGIGTLDAVFVSHEDSDHISGIFDLMDDMEKGGIHIDALFLPDIGRDLFAITEEPLQEAGDNFFQPYTDAYAALVQRAFLLDIPVQTLHAGQHFNIGELNVTCLGPVRAGRSVVSGNPNAHSMILHVTYGSFSALFTGDVEEEGLAELKLTMKDAFDVDLLKVPHHGSRYTTDEAFLAFAKPEVALISSGRNNRYGHPHAETLERLQAYAPYIFNTAKTGAVTVTVTKKGEISAQTYLQIAP